MQGAIGCLIQKKLEKCIYLFIGNIKCFSTNIISASFPKKQKKKSNTSIKAAEIKRKISIRIILIMIQVNYLYNM